MVSGFRICAYELGNGVLTTAQHIRLREAVQAEVDHLSSSAIQLNVQRPRLASIPPIRIMRPGVISDPPSPCN